MPKKAAAPIKPRKGSGKRRKFKGRMALPGRDPKTGRVVPMPRSQTHGGHSQARKGWTCDDTHDPRIGTTGTQTKSSELGRYRVTMPGGRVRFVRGA